MTARAVRRRTVEINYHTRQNSAYRFGHTNSGRSSERPFFHRASFPAAHRCWESIIKNRFTSHRKPFQRITARILPPLQVVRGIANKKVTVSGGRREIGIPHWHEANHSQPSADMSGSVKWPTVDWNNEKNRKSCYSTWKSLWKLHNFTMPKLVGFHRNFETNEKIIAIFHAICYNRNWHISMFYFTF